MSSIATQIGPTPSDILSKKTATVNTRRMYKTEIDLHVACPRTQNAFLFTHKDPLPASPSEQPPAVRVMLPGESALDTIVSRSSDPAGENHNDGRMKVETKSVGKISTLITRFNGEESRVPVCKLPTKQFRIDLRNVHRSHDTDSMKASVSLSGQGDQEMTTLASEPTRLSVVQLNGKVYTQTVKSEHATLNTNMSTRLEQLCVLKIPPKPTPKSKDKKNSVSQTAAICQPNTKESVAHVDRPSDLRLVTPFVNNEVPRTNNFGTVSKTSECENGRLIYIQGDVSVRQSNQSGHKLTQSQSTDSASATVMLPKDSCKHYNIYRDDEILSTQQSQVGYLKGTLTDSFQQRQQKTTSLKPALLPSHGVTNKISQVNNNGKLFTDDVILGSVVTLDAATLSNTMQFGRIVSQIESQTESQIKSQIATLGVSSDTSCDENVVNVTEESKDPRRSNEKADVVISQNKVYNNVENDKANPTKSNGAGHFIKYGENRHENMTGNCIIVFGCSDLNTTGSSVAGCKISTDPSVDECTPCKESSANGSTVSADSGIFACTTSTDSRLEDCETSTDTAIDECKISTESSIDGSPTSTDTAIDECKISTESSIDGSPTSRELTVDECKISTESSVDGSTSAVCRIPTSPGRSVAECSQDDYTGGDDTITAKLDMLKSELMAMRKMDLVLLRQLINISQVIQHIQRSDLPKMSRSLTILSSKKNLQPCYRLVERQNSAPHCADRRRFLFSNAKWKTEDDYRDSLSSFDESEADSQSELEESTSSLNTPTSSLSRWGAARRMLFQSRNIPLSTDLSEDADQSYEDILQRNVRLWKMSFQRHQSLQQKVDVWF